MNKSTSIRLGFVTLSTLGVLFFCTTSMAQSKIESYLKRKDANQNGRVEPSEMSENTKSYLRKVGFDPSKPVSIAKVVARDNKSKSNAARTRQNKVARKVPGFGAEGGEKQGVQSFSYNANNSRGAGASGNAPASKYSDKVKEQVNSTLDRYDRNKDGSLDKNEQSRARWGSPPPETNDLNKDGRLSYDELAKRYSSREKYYRQSRSSSSNKKSESKSDIEQWRRSGRSSSASSSSSRSRKTTSSKSSSKSDRSKYLKYAQSLVESYDKDKDGKLSKEEVKKMRRPPVGADVDKDGFITENELVDSLSGANKNSSSASKTASTSGSKYKSRKNTSSSSRGRSRSRSSSMSDLDKNGDNQIQMHEFAKADEWDDKVLAEYYAKDKNGDGIITSSEWSSR